MLGSPELCLFHTVKLKDKDYWGDPAAGVYILRSYDKTIYVT